MQSRLNVQQSQSALQQLGWKYRPSATKAPTSGLSIIALIASDVLDISSMTPMCCSRMNRQPISARVVSPMERVNISVSTFSSSDATAALAELSDKTAGEQSNAMRSGFGSIEISSGDNKSSVGRGWHCSRWPAFQAMRWHFAAQYVAKHSANSALWPQGRRKHHSAPSHEKLKLVN
jgi:Tfp pilus assembly protein PilV